MKKRQDVELLRLLSAAAIIWYHSRVKGHDVALTGLIVFLMLSPYLSNHNVQDLAGNIEKRFRRLIVPWAFWFLVYGIVNALEGRRIVPAGNSVIGKILVGTSVHLWYIPFIFLFMLIVDTARAALPPKLIGLFAGLAATGILALTPWWRPASLEMGFPRALWAHAAAAVLLGTLMSHSRDVGKGTTISIMGASFAFAISMLHYVGVGIPYGIGIAIGGLLLSGSLERLIPIDLTYFSSYTFGVYLIHMLMMDHLQLWFNATGYALPMATLALSVLCVVSMRLAFPKYAWLLSGEGRVLLFSTRGE